MPDEKKQRAFDQLHEMLESLGSPEPHEAASLIQSVAYHAFKLGLSQANTFGLLRLYFKFYHENEGYEEHRIWWITLMVREGREQAKTDDHEVAITEAPATETNRQE